MVDRGSSGVLVDGFQPLPSKKKKANKKRVFLGNVPTSANPEAIQSLIVQRLGRATTVEVTLPQPQQRDGLCHATTAVVGVAGINKSQDELVRALKGLIVNGQKLTVLKRMPTNKTANAAFGQWSKPTVAAPAVAAALPAPTSVAVDVVSKEDSSVSAVSSDRTATGGATINELSRSPAMDPLAQHEVIASIVRDATTTTDLNPPERHPLDAALVSTAAVTMLLAAVMGEQPQDATPQQQQQQQVQTTSDPIIVRNNINNKDDDHHEANSGPTELVDFHALCQKPLSSLMDEYGAQDLDWQAVQPTVVESAAAAAAKSNNDTTTTTTNTQIVVDPTPECRLAGQGKAPIHVELTTFGHRHGVPSEIRSASTGNSHRQPLPVFDCRCLAPVAPYLAWMDGKSGAVKNTMLRGKFDEELGTPNIRDYARHSVAAAVADAVQDAIAVGRHGYAQPLRMIVYLGSDNGRHRSVVAAELAGTALRKLLRQNKQNRFGAPVSVGCTHRDINSQQPQQDRRKGKNAAAVATHSRSKKQKDLEDE